MESGRNLVEKAEQNLESAKETSDDLPLASPSKVVSDAQKAIEQAAKALFLLTDVPFPEKHGFDISENGQAADLIKKAKHGDFPDGFVDENKVPRILFRTHFWLTAYEPAKYPIQELDVSSDELFTEIDAELAVEHAEEAVLAAKHLMYALPPDN